MSACVCFVECVIVLCTVHCGQAYELTVGEHDCVGFGGGGVFTGCWREEKKKKEGSVRADSAVAGGSRESDRWGTEV